MLRNMIRSIAATQLSKALNHVVTSATLTSTVMGATTMDYRCFSTHSWHNFEQQHQEEIERAKETDTVNGNTAEMDKLTRLGEEETYKAYVDQVAMVCQLDWT